MLDIRQIQSFYPEKLRPFRANLLREYFQHKILETIFTSPFGGNLCFMGGTALRILHGGSRFSEDLDFDNRGLARDGFIALGDLAARNLRLEGYGVETRNVFGDAWHCYLKIAGVLHQSGVSRHAGEKLMIQIDTEPQNFEYEPQRIIVNQFDVFVGVSAVPLDILLSQKIACIMTRKRPMGRDFFDVVSLMAKTGPNFQYLQQKLQIARSGELLEKLLARCRELNFRKLAEEVRPLLFDSNEAGKVLHFVEYLEQAGIEKKDL